MQGVGHSSSRVKSRARLLRRPDGKFAGQMESPWRLSDTLFYAQRMSEVVYSGRSYIIPAVSKLEDHTKMSGPSALRELITTVLGNAIADSPVYANLTEAFDKFEQDIKAEKSEDGYSLKSLNLKIADELSAWFPWFRI
jgi:putative ATP-dependent endonuclease of the OLD family